MGRCMFSPDVIGTDAFLYDLPDEAQLLYYRLGCEGTYGKIVGIRRIVRGYGSSTEALEALYEHGYLFDYGGACWVRHYWVNNVFKHPNHDYAQTMQEIESGVIGFEGDRFKSAFVLMEDPKPYESLNEGSTVSDSGSLSDPEPSARPDAFTENISGGGACGEGGRKPPDMKPCPQCRQPVLCGDTPEGVLFDCPSCGLVLVNPDGEIAE